MAELSSSPAQAVVWDDVAKVYPGGHQAVRGVSLSVARGEILALLGTSGSGKTTLLKMVNALMEPSSGLVVTGLVVKVWWSGLVFGSRLDPCHDLLEIIGQSDTGSHWPSRDRWRPQIGCEVVGTCPR